MQALGEQEANKTVQWVETRNTLAAIADTLAM